MSTGLDQKKAALAAAAAEYAGALRAELARIDPLLHGLWGGPPDPGGASLPPPAACPPTPTDPQRNHPAPDPQQLSTADIRARAADLLASSPGGLSTKDIVFLLAPDYDPVADKRRLLRRVHEALASTPTVFGRTNHPGYPAQWVPAESPFAVRGPDPDGENAGDEYEDEEEEDEDEEDEDEEDEDEEDEDEL